MTYLESITLGIVQGLTEFLPISSSGHLVLAEHLMGVHAEQGVVFEVVLHLATLLSVVIYFRKRLIDMTLSLFKPGMKRERMLIFYLFIGTLPAVFAGLGLKKYFEQAYEMPALVAGLLCVTGVVLMLPTWFAKHSGPVTAKSAVAMGVGQAFAILPGISRSGTTIVAGRLAGVNPSAAAEFSFLLAIPAIAGAGVLTAKDLLDAEGGAAAAIGGIDWGVYGAGALASFLFGLLAVYLVLSAIRRGRFQYFAYYCFAVGLAALVYFTAFAR